MRLPNAPDCLIKRILVIHLYDPGEQPACSVLTRMRKARMTWKKMVKKVVTLKIKKFIVSARSFLTVK